MYDQYGFRHPYRPSRVAVERSVTGCENARFELACGQDDNILTGFSRVTPSSQYAWSIKSSTLISLQ